MTAYTIVGATLVLLFVLIVLKESFDYKKHNERIFRKAKKAFGTFNSERLSLDELDSVKRLFYRYETPDSIDDITANDIDLDEIFQKFNNCKSSCGSEYFYSLLRNPCYDEDKLASFNNKVEYLKENESVRDSLLKHFLLIGSMKRVNFLDCLDYIDSVKKESCLKDVLLDVFFFLSIILAFVMPSFGVICLILSIVINIITYYKSRGEIDRYIVFISFISRFLNEGKKLDKDLSDVFESEKRVLSDNLNLGKRLISLTKAVNKSSGATGAGSPIDIGVDYIKVILHIDIICFYRLISLLSLKKQEIEETYITLGKLETYLNVASLREALPFYTTPKKGDGFKAKDLYHPLIDEPVLNSIDADKGVLITGSNASGKSTFLKAVCLNAIFAKTIYTCLCKEIALDDYHILSSMSLRDDIMSHDSYFMVEIKALKRIFDYRDKYRDKKILCFVDEVLRGTNTVERIACATQILKAFNKENILCFAATHDIELTDNLKDEYDNYHFDEEIVEDDVLFNYMIKHGKATSRNAIKLLSLMGFSDDIIKKADKMAKDFTETKVWG
ncbi:MAG: hypothetical protein K6A29_09635 [Lachnospiraceae bacterium]|nr:hypothetical protein [Lachnospiraceae bacterium]